MDIQTKRTYKKWSDEEMSKLLNFLKAERNFEKPTAQIFYKKCIKQTNIEAEWSTLRFKVRHLKLTYMKAKNWRNQAHTGHNGDEELRAVQQRIQNICPYFNELENIFDRRKCEPEYHDSGLLSISDNSMNPCQVTFTVLDVSPKKFVNASETTLSEQSLTSDTSIHIKSDLSESIVEPYEEAATSIISVSDTTLLKQSPTTDSPIRVKLNLSESINASEASVTQQLPTTDDSAGVASNLTHQKSAPKNAIMQLAIIQAERIAFEKEKYIADERFRQQQLELEKQKFEHEKEKANKKLKLKRRRLQKEMDLRKYELELKYGVAKNDV